MVDYVRVFLKYYAIIGVASFIPDYIRDCMLLRVYKRTNSEQTRAFIGHYRRYYYEDQSWGTILLTRMIFPYDYLLTEYREGYKDDFKKLTETFDALAEWEEKNRSEKNQ